MDARKMIQNIYNKILRSKNLAGDMMIEVLIAIVILSILLIGGYSLSHRSLVVGNNADLRSQAQSLAQGQIERMISTQNSAPAELSRYTIDNRPFCIEQNGEIRDANTSARVCSNYDGK